MLSACKCMAKCIMKFKRVSVFCAVLLLPVIVLCYLVSVFSCAPINIVDNYQLTIITDNRYIASPASTIPVKQYKKYAISTSLPRGMEDFFTFDSWSIVEGSDVVFDNAHQKSTLVRLNSGDAVIRPLWLPIGEKVVFNRQDLAGLSYPLQ